MNVHKAVTDPALSADAPEAPPPIPGESPPSPETAAWRWWIHLIVLAVYPLLGVFLQLATGRSPRGPALSGKTAGLLFVSGFEILFFAIFFLVAWLASRASRDQLMFRWRPGWWVVPLGLGYSIALRFAVVIAAILVMTVLVASRTVTPERVQEYVEVNRPDVESIVSVKALQQDPAYYWLTLTVVSFVVAGLREEMWRAGVLAGMRALWPRVFGSRIGQCAAITLIAIVFGAMHLRMGVIAAVGAGLLGLLLGFIMVLHKSIWPAVIAHGLFDATTLAFLPWVYEKARYLHGPG